MKSIKKALRINVATFLYRKKDGELRIAIGTKNLNLIPEIYHPIGDTVQSNINNIRYFDLEKQAWRSFQKDSFVGFITGMIKKEKDKSENVDDTVSV